jgi:hypothetical protein
VEIKPIPEWRRAWRMISVQAASLILVWIALPEAQQAAILSLLGIPANAVTGVLAAATIFGRLINQPKVRE